MDHSWQDSQKLSDDAHRDFNNHIRAHYNYLENVASALALLAGSSIGFPRLAAAFGALFIVARQLYAFGYVCFDPCSLANLTVI